MKKQCSIPFTMPEIAPPVFSDDIFDIREFGAVDGGETLNTEVFKKAVTCCAESGGGTVLVPAGTWPTGPIHLASNVRLHLEKNALVRFSNRPEDYLPVVFTRWEGIECYNYSPLIYANACENLAITGEGVFDGQGEAWWGWICFHRKATQRLYSAEHNGLSVDKRVFGTRSDALRPQFIQPINCRNVLIEGVTIKNGPMWTIHPVYCENIIVRNVNVLTVGPNTDGLNPDSCRNVLIENCFLSTGDDCIAINSGLDEDGWRVNRPCENIIIRYCRTENGHGGVVIGSGMSGGVRNVYVHDCHFNGTTRGIRLKSKRGRGGVVENIWFDRISMEQIPTEVIIITTFYGASSAASQSRKAPKFRNINISSVSCSSADTAVQLIGLPEQPLEDITITNLNITSKKGMICKDVVNLRMTDLQISTPEDQ